MGTQHALTEPRKEAPAAVKRGAPRADATGMSPAAVGVRHALFLQAGITLLFGLLRPGASTAWTVGTVAVAVAAVGLGAALQATSTMRTAVLGFEGVALAFAVVGLTAGHYVPGTVIGLHVLVKLVQTSAAEFAADRELAPADASPADGAAPAPWAAPVAPGAPAPWAPPPGEPVATVPAAPAPVHASVPFAAPFAAPGGSPWQTPAPFLPPQPGAHPAGRTVVPLVPQQPVAPPVVQAPLPAEVLPEPAAVPVPAGVAAVPSPLEEAASTLVEAPPVVPVAPVPVPKPEPPTTAPACMTILPG